MCIAEVPNNTTDPQDEHREQVREGAGMGYAKEEPGKRPLRLHAAGIVKAI